MECWSPARLSKIHSSSKKEERININSESRGFAFVVFENSEEAL